MPVCRRNVGGSAAKTRDRALALESRASLLDELDGVAFALDHARQILLSGRRYGSGHAVLTFAVLAEPCLSLDHHARGTAFFDRKPLNFVEIQRGHFTGWAVEAFFAPAFGICGRYHCLEHAVLRRGDVDADFDMSACTIRIIGIAEAGILTHRFVLNLSSFNGAPPACFKSLRHSTFLLTTDDERHGIEQACLIRGEAPFASTNQACQSQQENVSSFQIFSPDAGGFNVLGYPLTGHW